MVKRKNLSKTTNNNQINASTETIRKTIDLTIKIIQKNFSQNKTKLIGGKCKQS